MILLFPVLSVWIGYFLALFLKPKSEKGIKLLLAFSGAFLLALTFFELLPKLYQQGEPKYISVFILLGIFLQIFLEFYSKGAEHGHIHYSSKRSSFPIMLFVSLSVHAFIEGIPIHEEGSILYAIVIHKLPVAILLSSFLISSNIDKNITILFIAAFSLITPLGSYMASYTTWLNTIGDELVGLAVGVFLHISTIILFESSQGHAFNLRKLLVMLVGIVLAYFI